MNEAGVSGGIEAAIAAVCVLLYSHKTAELCSFIFRVTELRYQEACGVALVIEAVVAVGWEKVSIELGMRFDWGTRSARRLLSR